ncbi:hypothetical protein G9A89_014065 [Geosiphon pyriformis]|nr:hypothetical protein G9A89_014065 [Geosiphon pyriformis]
MGDYSYLPQQSEEYFEAHNKNNLDFIELNPLLFCLICFLIEEQFSKQFQDFWNWFLNEHLAEAYTVYTTYYFDQAYFEDNFKERNNSINQLLYSITFKQQPLDSEYLNYQIHIWIAAYQLAETLFETEEESYQTASVFNLFSSKSKHFIQTVIFELMANDLMQQNILIGEEITLYYLYSEMTLKELLQPTNNEYKFQIIGGYLQGFLATWFSQKTNAGAPTNAGEENTSFTIQFETKFRTPILISKWHMELEKKIQGSGEVKIHSFTKGLRTDLSYVFWSLLALKNHFTMDMVIKLAQRIKDNQKMHLESTFPVFASVSVMTSAPQMAATFFVAQTPDSNEQLIDRLTANFVWLLEPLAQAVRENQQLQRPRYEPHFNQLQQFSYQRQQNHGSFVCYHCGLTGHFFKDCNNPPLPFSVLKNNNN